MVKFDALTKAKTAAESAAAKAGELRDMAAQRSEQAKNLAADVREQASSRVGDLKDRLSGKVAEIKDAAVAGIKDLADDLNAHLPALREAGYTLTHVALEIGISPKVKAAFAAAPDISQERVDAVIEEHKDARATVAMLRALYGAYKLQNSIRIAGMKPCDIELEIGLTPAAIVRFA
jgi:dGTP triphosphohydrolase